MSKDVVMVENGQFAKSLLCYEPEGDEGGWRTGIRPPREVNTVLPMALFTY